MKFETKYFYVAYLREKDGFNMPIATSNTLEGLKLGILTYYEDKAKFIGWNPHNPKYPDDYQGYFEFFNDDNEKVEIGVRETVTIIETLNTTKFPSEKDVFYQKQLLNPYPKEEYAYTAYEKGFLEGSKLTTKIES